MHNFCLPKRLSRKRAEETRNNSYDFVVIGAGIAGTCVCEELYHLCPSSSILLISASKNIKEVICRHQFLVRYIFLRDNLKMKSKLKTKITENLDEIYVHEKTIDEFHIDCPNVQFINGVTTRVDSSQRAVIIVGKLNPILQSLCILSRLFSRRQRHPI